MSFFNFFFIPYEEILLYSLIKTTNPEKSPKKRVSSGWFFIFLNNFDVIFYPERKIRIEDIMARRHVEKKIPLQLHQFTSLETMMRSGSISQSPLRRLTSQSRLSLDHAPVKTLSRPFWLLYWKMFVFMRAKSMLAAKSQRVARRDLVKRPKVVRGSKIDAVFLAVVENCS